MPTFFSTLPIFTFAILLRVIFLLYGLFQDAYSPLKFTDIDYFVFTDAACFTAAGLSPYDRATYRYTPLLAWLLLPTTLSPWTFSFGKVVFAAADILAGWLMVRILCCEGMERDRALKYASIWLLNPMVATISTRGSSEGLLGVMVMGLLWAACERKAGLAGVILGLAVHFKIYPFIYAAALVWWLDDERIGRKNLSKEPKTLKGRLALFLNGPRILLATTSFMTFMLLNGLMYLIYGQSFITHTYLHHITRIDHRHNFSPYNTLLYLTSSFQAPSRLHLESLAFLPQLFLSAIAIPYVLAKRDLPSTMLAQTFAFVTLNKVCTSQYFLWYMVFLPFYLPKSSLVSRPYLGISAASIWLLSQALWLHQGYQLEFLGQSSFVPGLWLASLIFFSANIWLLGIVIQDISKMRKPAPN